VSRNDLTLIDVVARPRAATTSAGSRRAFSQPDERPSGVLDLVGAREALEIGADERVHRRPMVQRAPPCPEQHVVSDGQGQVSHKAGVTRGTCYTVDSLKPPKVAGSKPSRAWLRYAESVSFSLVGGSGSTTREYQLAPLTFGRAATYPHGAPQRGALSGDEWLVLERFGGTLIVGATVGAPVVDIAARGRSPALEVVCAGRPPSGSQDGFPRA